MDMRTRYRAWRMEHPGALPSLRIAAIVMAIAIVFGIGVLTSVAHA
jgi:hypothetical protein